MCQFCFYLLTAYDYLQIVGIAVLGFKGVALELAIYLYGFKYL